MNSVPRTNLEFFKISKFGVLFQFNDNLRVDFSPKSAAMKVNLTAGIPALYRIIYYIFSPLSESYMTGA
jgi:hypothetical protein